MRPVVLTLAVLAACGATARAAEEKTYEFGGLRKVKVTLTIDEADFQLQVRMLAVRCFDDATNREVNHSLAREYALQALARHLSNKPAVELAIRGAREVRAGVDGKSYQLTLRVPRDGVSLISAGDEPRSGAGRPAASGDGPAATTVRAAADDTLSQRQGQYRQMIREWGTVTEAGLREVVRKNDDPDALGEALGAFKKKLQANADGLGDEIKSDTGLFSIGSDLDPTDRSEKDQLLDALERERQRLLRLCAVSRPHPSPSSEKKP